MATFQVANVRLAGIASAVPERTVDVNELAERFGDEEARKISSSTGVYTRHVVGEGLCTSDLCAASAEKLLAELGWERDSVDAIVFVSQTPDYILPATSCVLHGRLGLSKSCAALDVNLGCSGYVYGLWQCAQMLAAGSAKRCLLLVGDTISRLVSPHDRSCAPLFGDAGTATAIEHAPGAPAMTFQLGTDGGGRDNLIVPAGGFRRNRSSRALRRTEREGGNVRSDADLFMNGAEVFAFTLREIPGLVRDTLTASGWSLGDVESVVMHQANAFLLKHLAKRLKLTEEQFVLALDDFGNTSCASIPLAMSHGLRDELSAGARQMLLVGFGVGFSWGAAAVTCGPLTMPEVIVVPNSFERSRSRNGERATVKIAGGEARIEERRAA